MTQQTIKYILAYGMIFLLISILTPIMAQTSNGSFGEQKGGLFKKKKKNDTNPTLPPNLQQLNNQEKKGFFSFLKRKENYSLKSENKTQVLEIIAETGAVKTYYFDGKKLNDFEIRRISKQIKKYEKQKPNKWEVNYLEMTNRGYPVHPDTVRKYKGLAEKVRRQKDSRTKKMNKYYQKSIYNKQGDGVNKEDIGDKMKAKNKETIKRHKKRSRQLKRKNRNGNYLPFYERWYDSIFSKKKKKRKK